MNNWEVVKDKTKPYWLELADPEGWWTAVVKWDGCIHLNHYYNTPFSDTDRKKEDGEDYTHICDLDDYIERLQELKAHALEHFGGWPR